MTWVDSFTEVQWDDVRAIRGEYIAASLCTDPADRPASEAAIRRMYELAGCDAPQFIWCQSPAAIRLMVRMLDPDSPVQRAIRVGEIPGGSPRFADWFVDIQRESFKSARAIARELHGELGPLLDDWLQQIRAQLVTASHEDVLSRPLPDLLGEPLGEAVMTSLEGIRWPPPPAQSEKYPWDARWPPVSSDRFRYWVSDGYLGSGWMRGGDQFYNWIAGFDVPRRLGLVSYDSDNERLHLLRALTRSCGWWEPYERICFITERPAVVRAVARGGRGQLRLHCPDGPAIRFRDGWSVYAWHGTLVPATLIEDGWDAAAIMCERNAEVRRCAIEKLGWDNFEQHLILVASAPDPGNPGQVLTLCDLPDVIRDTYSGRVRLLLCSNGTPEPDGTRRRFALPVPPQHTDPVAAAAELYGWTRREYAALARRA